MEVTKENLQEAIDELEARLFDTCIENAEVFEVEVKNEIDKFKEVFNLK